MTSTIMQIKVLNSDRSYKITVPSSQFLNEVIISEHLGIPKEWIEII